MSMAQLVRRAGEPWILTTFTEGARDDYGDVGFTAATAGTIRGVRIDAGNRTYRDETGEQRLVDVAILVQYPLTDVDGNAVTIPDDSGDRAPTLTDAYGRTYKVVGVGHAGEVVTGHTRILCAMQA